MARDFNGSTGYLTKSVALAPSAYPVSMACWFYPDSDTVGSDLMAITDLSSTADGFRLMYRGDTTNVFDGGVRGIGSQVTVQSTTAISAGQWCHVCVVFASATSRSIYVNGTNKQTNTTSKSPTWANLDTTSIGCYLSTSVINPTNGKIAEAGFWLAELTDSEVAALADGCAPSMVRPDALVGYAPIFGRSSPEYDWVSQTGWTVVGTATQSNHPPMRYPGRVQSWRYGAATGANGTGAITEAGDTLSSAAIVDVAAAGAITEAGDTLSSAAIVDVAAAGAITEAGDTLSSAAIVDVAAAGAITEAGDTLASEGVVGSVPVEAAGAITEAGDTLSSAAIVDVQAAGSLTEASDTVSSVGAAAVQASGSITEAGDAAAGEGTAASLTPVSASGAITEAGDTLSASGSTGVFVEGNVFVFCARPRATVWVARTKPTTWTARKAA